MAPQVLPPRKLQGTHITLDLLTNFNAGATNHARGALELTVKNNSLRRHQRLQERFGGDLPLALVGGSGAFGVCACRVAALVLPPRLSARNLRLHHLPERD